MRSAASIVVLVSFASSGETSMETQPSMPCVRSNSGRNKSAARRRSSSASSMNSSSPDRPAPRLLPNALVVCRSIADGFVENRGIGGEAGDRQFFDVAAQRAVVENFPRDVVEPEALTQIVQGLRDGHESHLKSDECVVDQIPDALDDQIRRRVSPNRTPPPARSAPDARTPSSAYAPSADFIAAKRFGLSSTMT